MSSDWSCDWIQQNITWKVLFMTVLLSFEKICLSSQGKNKHFHVKQDKVVLNPWVKNKNCFFKVKFKSSLKSYSLSMKMRLDSEWTLFALFCRRVVAKYNNVNDIPFSVCYLSLGRFTWYFTNCFTLRFISTGIWYNEKIISLVLFLIHNVIQKRFGMMSLIPDHIILEAERLLTCLGN